MSNRKKSRKRYSVSKKPVKVIWEGTRFRGGDVGGCAL